MSIPGNAIGKNEAFSWIYWILFLALLVYFFLMYVAGWVHITELRLFNLVILIAGVYFALKQYQRTHRGEMDYFHAFTTGIWTISIGTTAFSIFLLIYLHLDKGFMSLLAEKQPLGFYLNPYIAAFIVALEGFFSGFFVTFLLSNFLADRKPAHGVRNHSEIIQ